MSTQIEHQMRTLQDFCHMILYHFHIYHTYGSLRLLHRSMMSNISHNLQHLIILEHMSSKISTWVHHRVLVGSILLYYNFLCCVALFVLLSFSSILCLMLHVSMTCGFSNVYSFANENDRFLVMTWCFHTNGTSWLKYLSDHHNKFMIKAIIKKQTI